MNRLNILSVLLSLLATDSLWAQKAGALIGQSEARQMGLQRIWFTQVEVNAGNSQLVHLTQHVSSTKSVTIHQISYDGGRTVITERDVDRFGVVIGQANAKKAADIKFSDLSNLKLNPKLETITIPQITLYAVTDAGIVEAIDSETGRMLWKAEVGRPGVPIEAVGSSDAYVAVVSGSDLYLLKAENGEYIWKRRVNGAPGAGPAVTSHLIFVPMLSGAMEAYEIGSTKMPPSIYKSQGRAMWQPVYTGTNVAWPTDRGHLYVSGATENRISFRLEANDTISAAAAVMPTGRLVASSIDGFVYCLQEANGVLLWRFSSGEPIMETPTVYGDSVYAVTSDGNLFAIDGELGQERWSTSGLSKVIGASQMKLYCLTSTGGFVVLDRQTGSRLANLTNTSMDLPFTNKETDRIILANQRGMIQCLREIQQEFPLIHVGLIKQEDESPKTPKKTTKPAAETPASDANPFGAPETKSEGPPPAKEEKKTDDPFGT